MLEAEKVRQSSRTNKEGLSYHTYGDFLAPNIVLLHGGGLSGKMWDEVVSSLTNYHVIVPDLPGHGGSAQLTLNLDVCTQLLFQLISHAANPEQPVHLVGLSLGGALALHLMQAKPLMFSRVMISGTSSGLNRMEVMLNNLNAPMYKILPASWIAALTIKSMRIPDRFHGQIVQDTLPIKPDTVRAMSRILAEFKLPKAPATELLVVVGEQETGLAVQSARKLCRQLQCEGRKVSGVGHAWNFQNPQLFAATIANWIENKPLSELVKLES